MPKFNIYSTANPSTPIGVVQAVNNSAALVSALTKWPPPIREYAWVPQGRNPALRVPVHVRYWTEAQDPAQVQRQRTEYAELMEKLKKKPHELH